jgi:hypothetical protein
MVGTVGGFTIFVVLIGVGLDGVLGTERLFGTTGAVVILGIEGIEGIRYSRYSRNFWN